MSLTVSEFEDLLDLNGSRFERWPDEVRADAEAMIVQSLDARRLYRQAQRLDAALDGVAIDVDPVDLGRLAAAIRGQSLATPQVKLHHRFTIRVANWLPEFGWPQLATLAAAASVGILVGWTAAPSLTDSSQASSMTVASELVQDGLLAAPNQ